jgi:soluble lytic murein transglycosylase
MSWRSRPFFTKGAIIMQHRFKLLQIILIGICLLTFYGLSSGADGLLSRAAAQFREKDLGDAYQLARKAEESPQRTFLLGVAALRLGNAEEALGLLAEAERKLPLVADYAAFYQLEASLRLKKYAEAGARAASFAKTYPASLLLRRAEKLYADSFLEAGDYKGAQKSFQAFVEKYPSGADSVDSLFNAARCREELGDKTGALQVYRNIWINNPTSIQSKKAQERLKELDKDAFRAGAYSAEDLLKRASSLYSQNEYSASLKTLEMIAVSSDSSAIAGRVNLRTGLTHYKLRQYKLAEKFLAGAAASPVASVRSEARFWRAKSLERLHQSERALALYMELVTEGKQQEYADDAHMEAAGLRRNQGLYADSAKLFEQVAKLYPESKFVPKSLWEAGWCRYLTGEYTAAVSQFKALLKDEAQREKALYWTGRALENSGGATEAGSYFKLLLDEYPAGFYATWHREQKGIKDTRESFGLRNPLTELPVAAGFEKPRLLASLGLIEEARSEMSAARKKLGDKKWLQAAIVRVYLEMEDYSSAVSLFKQIRPIVWEKSALPLWAAGYPLAYSGPVAQNAAVNTLPESLIYALIRTESTFMPSIKSHAGAIGLMQMMPATAKQTAREKGVFNPQRLINPEYNIRLGTRHLRDLMKEYDGDIVYVAAAYNAGAAALERWRRNHKGLKKDEFIENISYQETRDYVKKIYTAAATYRQLYGMK